MLEKLLAMLPPGQREATEAALEDNEVRGIVVWVTKGGDFIPQAFDAQTRLPDDLTQPPVTGARRVGWWSKEPPEEELLSRTRRAYEWWQANPGHSGRDAAVRFGVSPSAVYRFAETRRTKPICPACGQVVKPGFDHTGEE